MYMVQTYHDYFERTKQNLYKSEKVQMPVPEIYVIYTGDRKEKPLEISLSQEFFWGKWELSGCKSENDIRRLRFRRNWRRRYY